MARSRANRRRTSRRRAPPIRGAVKTALHGRKISPTADPRSVTKTPWNSLTIATKFNQATVGTAVQFNPQTVGALLKSQVGLPSSLGLEIRLIAVRAWSLNSGGIAMRVWDFLSEASNLIGNPLAVLTDFPGRNQWARVGYKYATTQTNNVFTDALTTPVLFETEGEIVSEDNFVHIQVLWRPSSSLTPVSNFSTPQVSNVV